MIVVSSFLQLLISSFSCLMPQVRRGIVPKDFSVPKLSEKILFCGWRRDIEDMIMVIILGKIVIVFAQK